MSASDNPPADARAQHIAFRLDPPAVARVDALIPFLSSAWHKAKRSDVLRALVLEALPILEKRAQEAGAPGSARRRARRD
jgi:hypothetical protein